MHKLLTFTIGAAAIIANYYLATLIGMFYLWARSAPVRGPEAPGSWFMAAWAGIIVILFLSPVFLWLGRRAHRHGHFLVSYLPLAIVATPGLIWLATVAVWHFQSGLHG